MQQLFSQTIRFKRDDGSEFPTPEKRLLGDIVSTFSGGTPTSTLQRYGGNIPFIKSGEINAETVSQYLTAEGLKNSSAKLVKKGDLLYALYGATSGEVGIARMDGAINQAVLCIRTKESFSYIYFFLEYMKKKLRSKYLQGGQGNFSADIVKSIRIFLPCLEEQQKIADCLSSFDVKIDAVAKQI